MSIPPPPPLFSLRGHDGAVNSLCYIGSENLVSGDVLGKVNIWNLEGRMVIAALDEAHEHSVLSVNRLPGGESFATCSRDGTVKIWDLETCHSGSKVPKLTLQTQARCFCNASTDFDTSSSGDKNLVLTAGSEESSVLLWDTRTSQVACHMNVSQEQGMVSSLLLVNTTSGGASIALVGCDDGSLTCVDLRLGQTVSRVQQLHHGESGPQPLLAIAAYAQAGTASLNVLTGGGDCHLQRCQLEKSELRIANCTVTLPVVGTSSIACRCDGRLIAAAHWDKTVRLYDSKRLKPLAVLRHHQDSAFGVAFGIQGTPGQALLASSGKDGLIAIWDIYSDKLNAAV